MNKEFASPAAIRLAERTRQCLQAGGRGSVVGVATPRTVGQEAGLLLRGRRRVFRRRQQVANLVTDSKRKPNGERLGAQRLPKLERKNHVQAYVGGEFHLGADHQARPSIGGHHASVGVAAHLATAGRGVFPGLSVVSSSCRLSKSQTPRTSRPEVTPNPSIEGTG